MTAHSFQRKPGGNWVSRWTNADGKYRYKSHSELPKTREGKRLALRFAQKHERLAFEEREGWRDPEAERVKELSTTPITEHVAAYIAHCQHVRMSVKGVGMKAKTLADLREASGVIVLRGLTRQAVDHYLQGRRKKGRSARTINRERADIVAFANWLKATNRIDSHNLTGIPKLNEEADRRREYRPFTEDDAARMLRATRERSERRYMTYLLALWTGLRWSEIRGLRWSDIIFDEGCLSVLGKNQKRQSIPIHSQLLEALAVWRERSEGPNVVDPMVTQRGFRADLEAAGIARVDAAGRVLTFHSWRATTGTMLARAGVQPQVAQRIMRHADYRTTLKHYTHLTLRDDAAALDGIEAIGEQEPATAERKIG